MVLMNFFLIFIVPSLFFKDIAAFNAIRKCSLITSPFINLSIFDLEDDQTKSVLYVNVTNIQNQSVGNFLDYLENEIHLSLSSHVASVKNLKRSKDVSSFTTIPRTTPLCKAIDVSHDYYAYKYTLFVGAKLTPQQALLRRLLKGIVIDDRTGLFRMSDLPLVIFNKTYQPVEKTPTPRIVIKKQIIETTRSKEMRKALVSLINKKTELIVEENKIDLEPSFVEKLYNIVDNNTITDFNRTKLVVEMLNRYGWFVPIHFTLGGRLDYEKSVTQLSDYNANEELEKLEAKVSAACVAHSGSVNDTSQQGSSSPNTSSSTVDQETDISSFMRKVQFKENWKIIAVHNIVPTCKFLLRKHSSLMSLIRQLILYNAHHSSISKLQPNINMIEYVNNIWSAYVKPF